VEHAELICDRSETLARNTPLDVAHAAIDLSRAADHSEATLRHAVGIGRARQRRRPHDASATRGAQLLEDVVAFLGVRSLGGDVHLDPGDSSEPCWRCQALSEATLP
jgi:hypothetical protein